MSFNQNARRIEERTRWRRWDVGGETRGEADVQDWMWDEKVRRVGEGGKVVRGESGRERRLGEEKSWREEESLRRGDGKGRKVGEGGRREGESRRKQRTYRSEPEEDFLEIAEANNLLVHDATWDCPDEGMERFELWFLEDGDQNKALNLLARRVGQLASWSGALVKV
jgi:hypothetical protein